MRHTTPAPARSATPPTLGRWNTGSTAAPSVIPAGGSGGGSLQDLLTQALRLLERQQRYIDQQRLQIATLRQQLLDASAVHDLLTEIKQALALGGLR